jgi:hypothetical protein
MEQAAPAAEGSGRQLRVVYSYPPIVDVTDRYRCCSTSILE